jgi:hypothetical protein
LDKLEPFVEIWIISLDFGWILAIENLKRHLTIALKKISSIAFWLFIATKKKGW